MKLRYTIILTLLISMIATVNTFSQTRVAVLPFQNMDGKFEFNEWCYSLQDSLLQVLVASDPDEEQYRIVPIDSVEAALADLNLDPANPQYFTDMWKAIAKLNVKKVVSGSFIVEKKSMLLKAAVYDVKLKLPLPQYQATNIFKDLDKAFDAIEEMREVVEPGLK